MKLKKRRNVRTASVVYYRDFRTHFVIFILILFGILSIVRNILLNDYTAAMNIGMKFFALLVARFGLYITSPMTDFSIYTFSILNLFNINTLYLGDISFFMAFAFTLHDMLRARRYIFTDSLTGLLNRRYFVEIVPKVVKLKEYIGKDFGIIVIDVNNFKPVNDKFGHKTGDYVLKKIGEIIASSVRKSDLPIRYGGDEFLILVSSDKEEVLDEIIERINKKIKDTLKASFNVSVAAGKYIKTKDDNITLEEMFETADKNMYIDKRRSKREDAR
ncbi:GGDEF domain-containing protein [Marinitoga sp. 1137]|uniref:GGDEF domain-containing protein n=1 Tax=Marinitoga sp. 1137 TaxID=1545835 RepID=UPI0018DC4E7C|nr:GGDEF domain-containing protein [Marinitoga sp. 1137]